MSESNNCHNKFNESNDLINLPIAVDEENVIEGAKFIVSQIRQHWVLDNIKFKLFTDGITNKLVGCFHHQTNENNNKHGEEVILIRVYGNKTDLLIDRDAEKKNIMLLHQYGYAPQLYATFKNGLVYEYVPGVTLTVKTILLPQIWKLVAKRMAQMHKNVVVEGSTREPMINKTITKFLNLIPEQFTDPVKNARVKKIFPPIQQLKDDFVYLYNILKNLNSPVVFCHNDLLLANVIYTEHLKKVTFIDYEYADYNYQAFDIGNHFTEFGGVSESEHDLYPSKEFQLQWLRAYLEEFRGSNKITDDDVENLYKQVNKFALASYYLWATWALIQTEHSYIEFDFISLAATRYNEYLVKKDNFLAL